tara:strand:+ start:123 stop:656 length:534 start_codon:yes stop_codon:yes gene_type:complete
VNSLPKDAQPIFAWLLSHLDTEGRVRIDLELIKEEAFPLQDVSIEQIDGWLGAMKGLIERYEVDGEKFIWMLGFLESERETDSVLKEFVGIYEKEISEVTPIICEGLKDWSEEYSLESFKYAVSEAVKNTARNPRYIEKILENRKQGGKSGKSRGHSREIKDRRAYKSPDEHRRVKP